MRHECGADVGEAAGTAQVPPYCGVGLNHLFVNLRKFHYSLESPIC